ncbi:Trk system potassium transporter TrkA [Lachnobacterium bovis]|uniref:Trk system potassium uptake protein TrkA n=1 Tax=Lachnobacterium bovis TaxID=140626 RepID=A0A1H9TB66_9FIRM|nr:Trk system potassium transporter TrkA [Lachnobacterium bovis]SER94401.1 trk system potassium uptake protein TrkA [Lachnobacterium bovis]
MRIIVIGCGKVGRKIVEELCNENHEVTVIDLKKKVVSDVTGNFDAMGIVGNGTSHVVLKEAGIENTDVLIAVTQSDELNLLCCLIAKKAGNCSTIARVRNPMYNNEISYIKEELGLTMTINPEEAAATEIARILRFPSANKVETFAKGKVELMKFTVASNSKMIDRTLEDIASRIQSRALICAIERGENVFIPNGQFVFKENDIVTVVCPPKDAKVFFEKVGIKTHSVKNAFLVGGGKIAYYLAKQLLSMGIKVKIFESDIVRCEELSELLPEAVIINADATDKQILKEEGLENSAESFVALTGIDESNIFLSLYAKKKSKAKVITKINRIEDNDIVNDFNLGSVISPKLITAEYIIRYVRAMQNTIGSNVETLYRIIENKAEALEFHICEGAPVIGIPLEKLRLKNNLIIASVNHKGKIITPNGKTEISVGDTVIVVTTHQNLNDIKDILM